MTEAPLKPASLPAGISQWSFSRLKIYKTCPYQAKLKYVDRKLEAPRPPPVKGKEHANERGSRMHDNAERYINGLEDRLCKENRQFEDWLFCLRIMKSQHPARVEAEQMWLFDIDWEPLEDPKDPKIWLRIIADLQIWNHDHTQLMLVDFKGLPLDTPLPTPTGWTTMGECQVGDQLIGSNGKPCTIQAKSTVKYVPCFKITFDDASTVICDEEHQWKLLSGEVVSASDLKKNQRIRVAAPLELPEQNLPIDPYLLGVWLADGKHTSGEITNPDNGIWAEIKRRGFKLSHDYSKRAKDDKCRVHTVYGFRTLLRENGLLGNKHIPEVYLRASYQQRLDLLQGLLDGDGAANSCRNQACFTSVDKEASKQFLELALSLGQRATMATAQGFGFGKPVTSYPVSFRPHKLMPFKLARKAKKALKFKSGGWAWRRKIRKIESIPAQQTQCVMVDSPDSTYLCTKKMIPTHNSGKRDRNEVSHGQQLQLYQLSAFMRHPNLKHILASLWYLDLGVQYDTPFTRTKGLQFFPIFDGQAKHMCADDQFLPAPSAYRCRFCPYGGEDNKWVVKTGDCEYGV
ncbi:MAG: hypothetical protein DRI46_10100 [Chloroflexi bacterium]|nr:MAG: hypothetical protein DRI46_10100 [Chloroflexota bacterium]